jgi:hypothetical protein
MLMKLPPVRLGSLTGAAAEFRKLQFVSERDERRPFPAEVAVVAVVAVVGLWWGVARGGFGLVLGPLGEGDAGGGERSRFRERRENGDRNGS